MGAIEDGNEDFDFSFYSLLPMSGFLFKLCACIFFFFTSDYLSSELIVFIYFPISKRNII